MRYGKMFKEKIRSWMICKLGGEIPVDLSERIIYIDRGKPPITISAQKTISSLQEHVFLELMPEPEYKEMIKRDLVKELAESLLTGNHIELVSRKDFTNDLSVYSLTIRIVPPEED